MTSSILYLNQAISGNGGGLYVGRTLDLRQSIFSGNTAGSEGGGLWLRVASGTTGKIINNLWSRNSSVRGYAMYLGPGKGRVDVQHNTVVGTVDGGHLGTGIYINGPGVTVENSIFTGYNSALYKSSGDTATSRFNLFYGNQTNNYNIDIVEIVFIGDPLFGDEYHLTGLSPAIDRGTNVGLNVDLSGAPRPCGAGYDIGAYEFQFECHAPTPDPSPGRPFALYLPLVVK